MNRTLPAGIILIMLFFSLHLYAQREPLPPTDIYLLDITTDKKGRLQFENPYLINKNEGYDNQPWWLPDGSALLYASATDTFRADILKFTLGNSKTTNIINTARTAEYSPVLMGDKISYSVVQVLEDDSTQVLAKCSDKEDECVNLLPKIKDVGYYCWIDNARVALYILGDPSSIQVVNMSTGKIDTIAEDAGRCIQKVPGKNLQIAFVDKGSNPWQIKLYDGKSGKISTVISTLEDEEDFCFMPDGSLLMGSGSELYHYVSPAIQVSTVRTATADKEKEEEKKNDKSEKDWQVIADFEGMPIEYFYRLAVSPKGDKIAIVTYEDEKP